MRSFLILVHFLAKPKVLSQKNIGEHLATVFADRDRMTQVKGCLNMFFTKKTWLCPSLKAIDQFVTSPFGVPHGKPHMTTVPNRSMEEFWLGLDCFDYSADGKNGCGGGKKVCTSNGASVSMWGEPKSMQKV